ncbi:MAG: hypothetical protein AAF658_13555 [Myxococcota bacterium]
MTWDRRLGFAACVFAAACTPDDSSSLVLEICDNGIDDDSNGATDCSDARCRSDVACAALAQCGDDVRSGSEFCDGPDLGGATCASQGFLADVGSLGCRSDCAGFDTSLCLRADLCGNARLDGAEACDGVEFGVAGCLSRGFLEGALTCTSACQIDDSGCTGVNPCGNGTVDAGEVCDGNALGSQTCASIEGFRGDGLACNETCDGFDTSACEVELCGNGRVDEGEVCDGVPEAVTCGDIDSSFAGGTVGCSATCDAFVTTACTRCGNNTIDEGEVCDGVALGGRTCSLEGFFTGELVCNSTCTGFDTNGCTNCGNDTIDDGEVCDGNTLPEDRDTCDELGFTQAPGAPACQTDCQGIIGTSCLNFAECGNGVLDGASGDRFFQEICEPGLTLINEPFQLSSLNPAAQGCLIYDSVAPFDDSAPILCNADCTIDIALCEGVPSGNFCEVLGWLGDGEICDPCDRIAGVRDPDCDHPQGGPTRCGDGIAQGTLAPRASRFNISFPSSPFDWCDGDDLRGSTCETLGFQGGTLACSSDCNFDTSGCIPQECGDGMVDGHLLLTK